MKIIVKREDFKDCPDDGASLFETFVKQLGNYHPEDVEVMCEIEIEVEDVTDIVYY